MTFDDGPSSETTPRLLEILKQRNIKVTFFLIGENAASNPDIVRRILADGHEIGNHSWTHPQLSRLSDDRVTAEINKTQDTIKDASGFTPTLLRPPYGAITTRQREWIESQFGLNIILWSVDPFDWKRPGASVITQRIWRRVWSVSVTGYFYVGNVLLDVRKKCALCLGKRLPSQFMKLVFQAGLSQRHYASDDSVVTTPRRRP